MIRILLVDDQKMIREALRAWLEPETDFQIIGTADNGITAVEQVERLQPDIVLMNIEMPGLDGASATQFITNKFDETKVLILSSDDSHEYVAKSLSVGAKGYLLKNTDFQDIASAIRSVHKGYTQIGPGLLDKLLIQTDSGTIINKITTESSPTTDTPLSRERIFIAKAKKAIANLQDVSRKHRAELDRLRNNTEQIQQEVSQSNKTLSRQSKYIGLAWLFLLAFIGIFGYNLFNFRGKLNTLARNSIPIERIGLFGEYDLSGLAQRVEKTYKRDFALANISTVHVSQKGSTIFLKGSISNRYLLQRMSNLAKDVKGVTDVDTSQVKIESPDEMISEIE